MSSMALSLVTGLAMCMCRWFKRFGAPRQWKPVGLLIASSSEPKKRVRYLLKSEAESLLVELPPHLSHMAAFSLATGLRKGNVLDLEWSQVDLTRRVACIHPDQSKSRVASAYH